MDIEYFFYVDDSTLQHLRPATSDERKWYHSLAQELGPYQKNIDRFQSRRSIFCISGNPGSP